MATTIEVERNAANVPLNITVSDVDGAVTGLTTVVAVRDGRTTDSFLDFDDDTFKTSAWTTKQAAMAEVGNGAYALSGGLDLSIITNLPAATDFLVAEYEVSGSVAAVSMDIVKLLRPNADDRLKDHAFTVAAGSTATEIRTNADQLDGFFEPDTIVVFDDGAGTVVARPLTGYLQTNGAFTVPNIGVVPSGGETLHVVSVFGLMRRAIHGDVIETEGDPKGNLALKWRDNVTVMIQWDLTDKDGNKTTGTVGSPARRENSRGT
jgi:hypothetical protein